MIWNFIDHRGKEHEIEKSSAKLAMEWAADWYGRYVDDNYELSCGQEISDIGYIVEVDDDGIEVERTEIELHYECTEEAGEWEWKTSRV